jgi:branched-chain amino acid transport system permease protein
MARAHRSQGGWTVLQYIVVGLVFGSIYALAASGLVITYVSTGVLNFAFGSFAYFVARTYYYLHVEQHWDIGPSAVFCLAVLSPAMGLFFYLAASRWSCLPSRRCSTAADRSSSPPVWRRRQ